MRELSPAPLAGWFNRPTIANFGWLSVDKVYRLGLGLIVGVWVARYLGPAGYGTMSYGLAIVGLVSALPSLGLDLVLRRELLRRPTDCARLLGTAFYIRLVGGVFIYAALSLFIRTFEADAAARLAVAMAGLTLIQQSVLTIDVWFQSQLQSKHTVIAQNAALTLTSLIRVSLILGDASLEWFLIAMALDGPLCAALLVAAYYRDGQRISGWCWDSTLARSLLTESWPLALSTLAILVYLKADQVLLRSLAGDAETGRYATAARLMEFMHMVPMMVTASLAPGIIHAKIASHAEFEARVRRLLSVSIGVAWVLALTVAIASTGIVRLLFGSAFAESAGMLAILALSLPFIAAGVARQEYLVNEGHMRFQLFTTGLGAVLSVALNLWWIPHWGGLGAAAAATTTCVVTGILSSFLWANTRQLGRWQIVALVAPWRVLTRTRRFTEIRHAWVRRFHEAVGSTRHSHPSLNNIDRQLDRIMDRDIGFFVEAGAHDGFTQSNTYYLERFRNWRGLLIEPVPALFERCRRERQRSTVVRAALVGPDHVGSEIELEYGDLMTVVPAVHADDNAKKKFVEMRSSYLPDCQPYRFQAPARTLSALLDEHAAGKTIDLLSLDIEGYELQALRGLDLHRHRPRFICVEAWDKPAIDALLTPLYEEVAILNVKQYQCDVLYRLRDSSAVL